MNNLKSKDNPINSSASIPLKNRLRTATKVQSSDNPNLKNAIKNAPLTPSGSKSKRAVTAPTKKVDIRSTNYTKKSPNTNTDKTSKKATPIKVKSRGAPQSNSIQKQNQSTGTQTQDCDNELLIEFQIQLSKYEETIHELRQKIMCLEELLWTRQDDENPPPITIQPTIPNKFSNTEPFSCYIIGDSHVRGLSGKLNELLPTGCTAQAVFQPGAGYEAIANTHIKSPNLAYPSPHDPVIIMCGTNDVCVTQWESIQRAIEKIIQKFLQSQLLCIIGVPFRYDNRKLNYHITRFNTKIRYWAKSLSISNCRTIQFIDPNNFLKTRDYAIDKLHLNYSGKTKLSRKIKNTLYRISPPDHLPHETLVPDDELGPYTSLPDNDDLIDLSNAPPLFPDSTADHTVIQGGPSESLLDTPNLPQHINNILLNESRSAMDHYRLTSITHSFSNAAHSSPLPQVSQDQNPGNPIEVISGFRPPSSSPTESTFSITPTATKKT